MSGTGKFRSSLDERAVMPRQAYGPSLNLVPAPSLEARQSRPLAAFQDRRREHRSEVNSREIDL
jgi:hypothetical protein